MGSIDRNVRGFVSLHEYHQAFSRFPSGVSRAGSESTGAETSLRVARYSASVRILWLVMLSALSQALTVFKRSISVIGCCGDSWKP